VRRSDSFLSSRCQMRDGTATLLQPVLELLDELVEIGEGSTPVLRRQVDLHRAGHIHSP
jgi:hypothetical protein